MDEPGPQVVALLAAATSFLFSLAESALTHYSPPRLLDLAKKRDREEAFNSFTESDEKILVSSRALAIFAMVAFTIGVHVWVTGGLAATDVWDVVRAGALSALGLVTIVRAIPILLGRIFPEALLLHLRPVLMPAHLVMSPITWFLWGLRRVTERLAGRTAEPEDHDQFEDEILSAVEEGEMEGVLHEAEAELIQRALQMRDADVADVMTPRTRMFALDITTPLDAAVAEVSRAGHSRVPVYRKNPDEIVGVLYAKDVLRHWGRSLEAAPSLARLARKPFFVPETKKISALLEEFRRRKTHIAVVLDEYGGTAGIASIEDILEEIVGEIEDEYDESVDVPLIEIKGEREVEIDGQVHVDDLAQLLETEIDSTEFDTVGGLVFTALGRIPATGDEFDYEDLRITVLAANERSVTRVRVVREPS